MERKDIKKTEKLYGALGELIYAVAKADGQVQDSEFKMLDQLLDRHEWKDTVRWSFMYEVKNDSDAEQVFQKVINKCEDHGPAREYLEFINIINQVAAASDGIDDNEREVIDSFSADLISRFKNKIKAIGMSRN